MDPLYLVHAGNDISLQGLECNQLSLSPPIICTFQGSEHPTNCHPSQSPPQLSLNINKQENVRRPSARLFLVISTVKSRPFIHVISASHIYPLSPSRNSIGDHSGLSSSGDKTGG